MQIRRFTAANTTEAMRLVRRELGPNAVILSTERAADGSIEISAAIEDMGRSAPKAPAANTRFNQAPKGPQPTATSIAALARRVENLGDILNRHVVSSEAAAGFDARPEVAPLYHHLHNQEVAPDIIRNLLDGLHSPSGAGLLPRLGIRFKKMLSVGCKLMLTPGRPVVWALVGPTGVGKTTTIAKLAAEYSIKRRLRVGMITADTFRMAAAEQLKVYGGIMDLPTEVAASADDMAAAVGKMADRDLILVDTVGRAPGDEASLADMASVLGGVPGMACHLVLGAPTRDSDQTKVVESFSRFEPQSLMFTKLDETGTFGPIVNQMSRTGLPVSYLTFGQKVPDDMEPADLKGLAKRILPSKADVDRLAGNVN